MALSPILKKLMFVRQFDIDKGKINLLGDKEIMLHASAILELQEIDDSKIYEAGKKSAFKSLQGNVEHAKVYSKVKDTLFKEITSLSKKIGETDAGTIKTLQEIFNLYGLGEMNIQGIDNSKKQALIVIRESTIAEEWIAKNKSRSKVPVCTLTAGVIAGVFSYIFGKEVDAVEESCKAQGKSYCLFKDA